MKPTALYITLFLLLTITPTLIALQYSGDIDRPTFPQPTVNPEKFEPFMNGLSDKIYTAVHEGIHDGVYDAAYYAIPLTCTITGAALFLYAVMRKDAGTNKKTAAYAGTGIALVTLGSLMTLCPQWFGKERHGY
ncbi:MAG: hypothetical protein K2X90_04205 [Candidatus Babeliaceae bacterium]|nr:hypothetical protein [Candidatus Babeliaceae bacterium]